MLKNRRILWLTIGLALLLAGITATVRAADAAEAEPAHAEGFSKEASNAESVAEVAPPKQVDKEVELNPVSEDSLLKLSAARSSDDPIFQKYARLAHTTDRRGIDHLAAGTGLRNTGFGTIRFRGIPPLSTAVSAFLYWAFIADTPLSDDIDDTQAVNFNSNPVTGSLVGTGVSPCWGDGTLRLYRAPVLSLLAAEINADYTVSGVPSNLTNGQDPWNPTAKTLPLAEGASLVVLYTHPSVPAGSWVQIHHPPLPPNIYATYGILTYIHSLTLPIRYEAMRHTRIGADGQAGFGLNHSNRLSRERTWLRGPRNSNFTQIRGDGSYDSGSEDSDWNGTDGEPLNHLWDTHTMKIPDAIRPGFDEYAVRYSSPNDCIAPAVHVITAR